MGKQFLNQKYIFVYMKSIMLTCVKTFQISVDLWMIMYI